MHSWSCFNRFVKSVIFAVEFCDIQSKTLNNNQINIRISNQTIEFVTKYEYQY